MKKLRADYIRGMLATVLFRVFCLPVSSINLKIKIHRTVILPVVSY